jgi:uncharacterized protein YkwD
LARRFIALIVAGASLLGFLALFNELKRGSKNAQHTLAQQYEQDKVLVWVKPAFSYLPLEKEILSIVNQHRELQGAKVLSIDERVTLIARKKAEEMMAHDYFAHESPYSGSLEEQYEKFASITLGVRYLRIGENLAKLQGYEREAVTAHLLVEKWMESPDHRQNILNPNHTHMGAAVCYSEVATYAVQEFVQR